ncbi:hypothetical protein BO70DRAFT_431737 [Aspergillus heteromorphus CBS 117.55]|uniref:Restriction of telomere capping protein 4 n=1 Tax=Aspergillus heteromorphus CBS 117.55 TaxID=1448321 RepID=A0A317VGT6_9EURO|nr:uncharacterized protein BO70DRAFT_431737 [Aspergillus heteromorphus CBS 117.55]PWY72357.1 hypothetical protein BO70DRAFT_431737 [Aspergillus heteromorphus CBS 117.55]
MVLPKPNSSFASNRLLRSDHIGTSLLSNFRKSSAERPNPTPKPEPATDDEPLSSTDDDSKIGDSDDSDTATATATATRRPRVSRPSLEEKLAKGSDGGRTPRASRQRNQTKNATSSPALSHKRSSREMAGAGDGDRDGDGRDSEEENVLFSSIRDLDRGHKRRKPTVGYQSRRSFGEASTRVTEEREREEQSASEKEGKAKKPVKKNKNKSKKKEEEKEKKEEEQTPKPQFKVPREIDEARIFKQSNDMISSSSYAPSSARDAMVFDYDDDDDSSVGTPLSTASSTLMHELEDAAKDAEPVLTEPSVCPWCKAPVDPGLLLQFRAQPKQRLREQQRFCDSHKQSSAEQEWKEKGYPTIDWEGFDARIERHFADLEKVMVPDSKSFYRNILDGNLKSGQAKNFRLTLDGEGLENISCGYYGTRGAGKMLQAITTRYARKLRRLAADDHIVKTAGVVGYAQAVLVPELAVRLVKEDMDVTDEAARQILRETIDIGEKLNFALNDRVPVPVPEEEE